MRQPAPPCLLFFTTWPQTLMQCTPCRKKSMLTCRKMYDTLMSCPLWLQRFSSLFFIFVLAYLGFLFLRRAERSALLGPGHFGVDACAPHSTPPWEGMQKDRWDPRFHHSRGYRGWNSCDEFAQRPTLLELPWAFQTRKVTVEGRPHQHCMFKKCF